MLRAFILAAVITSGLAIGRASADIVYLTNGDRITGQVLDKGLDYLKVKTAMLGNILIEQKKVSVILAEGEELARAKTEAKKVIEAETAKASPPLRKPKYWNTKISAGYTTTNGNTKNSHINVGVDAKYKKENNEWSFKGAIENGSDKGKMNTQKAYGKAQSDTRLGAAKKWFNSRSIEITHDRFSNIDYRVLPAVGIGYWFFEGDRSKLEVDMGLGYEYTDYRDSTKPSGNMSLIPHAYYDRVLIGKLKFAQDITLYPSLDNLADYRLRSVSSLVNPLSDALSWKVSFIDEYNSSPKGTTKKNDTSLISAIEYAF